LLFFFKSLIYPTFYSSKTSTILFINVDIYKLELEHDLQVSGQEKGVDGVPSPRTGNTRKE